MQVDQMIPYLEPYILKLGGKHLDRSMQGMKITSTQRSDIANIDPLQASLAEDVFDFFWGAIVEFIGENRTDTSNKGAEFLLEIGSNCLGDSKVSLGSSKTRSLVMPPKLVTSTDH